MNCSLTDLSQTQFVQNIFTLARFSVPIIILYLFNSLTVLSPLNLNLLQNVHARNQYGSMFYEEGTYSILLKTFLDFYIFIKIYSKPKFNSIRNFDNDLEV